jgi:mycofactocin precursor
MSERAATAEVLGSTQVLENTELPEGTEVLEGTQVPGGTEPELATADLLVEEVSIDGMCGVY